MTAVGAYLRSLDPRLPRSIWILNAGGLMNAFGTGIAYPFIVIYLHNVRGFSLGISGLILAASGAAGILTGPAIGAVIDKIGGRLTLAGALVLQAIGWGSFAFVHEPWHAVFAAIVAGVGNAASGRVSPRCSPASRPRRAATARSRFSA